VEESLTGLLPQLKFVQICAICYTHLIKCFVYLFICMKKPKGSGAPFVDYWQKFDERDLSNFRIKRACNRTMDAHLLLFNLALCALCAFLAPFAVKAFCHGI
jgi:hypothetical protein